MTTSNIISKIIILLFSSLLLYSCKQEPTSQRYQKYEITKLDLTQNSVNGQFNWNLISKAATVDPITNFILAANPKIIVFDILI